MSQDDDDLERGRVRRRADLFRGLSWPWAGRTRFVPVADVFERDGDLVVRAELPDIDPEKDLTVTLREGQLLIKGERKQKKTGVKEADCYRIELPEGTDESKIAADYGDGVLEVVVRGATMSAPAPTKRPLLSPAPGPAHHLRNSHLGRANRAH